MSEDEMSTTEQPGHVAIPMELTNACFGCGPANDCGLKLEFYSREDTPGHMFCDVRIDPRFEGPPGHVHGGVIATILDEAMGKANKLNNVVALTRTMDIQYLKPVPLQTELRIEGWNERREGRKNFNAGVIRNAAGETLATSTGLFIEIDAETVRRVLAERGRAGQ